MNTVTINTLQQYNSHTADKFVVRLPPGLRDKIAVEAKANHRSMNSEIIHTLGKKYDPSNAMDEEPVSIKTRALSWIPALGMLVQVEGTTIPQVITGLSYKEDCIYVTIKCIKETSTEGECRLEAIRPFKARTLIS